MSLVTSLVRVIKTTPTLPEKALQSSDCRLFTTLLRRCNWCYKSLDRMMCIFHGSRRSATPQLLLTCSGVKVAHQAPMVFADIDRSVVLITPAPLDDRSAFEMVYQYRSSKMLSLRTGKRERCRFVKFIHVLFLPFASYSVQCATCQSNRHRQLGLPVYNLDLPYYRPSPIRLDVLTTSGPC
jgi:hypothetical protein